MGALLGSDPPKRVAALLAEDKLEVEAGVRCRAVPGGRATTTMVLKGVRLAGEGARLYERLPPCESFVATEEAKTGAGSLWRAVIRDHTVLRRFMEPFGLDSVTCAPLMVQVSSRPEWGGGFTGLVCACTDECDDFRVWSFLRCEACVDGDAGRSAGCPTVIVWDRMSFAPPPFARSPPGEPEAESVLGGGGGGGGGGGVRTDCLTVPFEVVTAMVRAKLKSLEGAQCRGPLVMRMLSERMLSVTPLNAEDAGHSARDLMQLVRSGRGVKPLPAPLGPTDIFMAVPQGDILAACASAATYGASHVFVTALVERVTDSEGRRSVTQVSLNLRSLQTSLGVHQRWFRGDIGAGWGGADGDSPLAEPIAMEAYAAHFSTSRTDVRTNLRKVIGLYPTKWLKAAVGLCPKAVDGDTSCLLVMRGTDKPLIVVAAAPSDGLHHLMRIRPASRPDVVKFSDSSLQLLGSEGTKLPAAWQAELTDV